MLALATRKIRSSDSAPNIVATEEGFLLLGEDGMDVGKMKL